MKTSPLQRIGSFLGRINRAKIKKLLPRFSYLRAAAVIFIGLIFVFLSHAIAGSFGSYPIDEETEMVREGSFFYASQYLNPEEVIIEEAYTDGEFFENPNIILQDSAFVGTSSPAFIPSFLGQERKGIVTYEVQSGDVPSQIAAVFGISTNTLLWANNLSVWDYIKPGQKLVILPVSGIKYKVQKGETLDKIVKKYKGDVKKTIEFNGLPADGSLAIDQEIIIPDGQKPVYSSPQTRSYASLNFPRPFSDQSHKFPWGQCTWYIAQLRYIPWGGDARNWIREAIQYGYATGNEPQPGAIMVTKENRYYGHVAYVEAVDGNYVTVSEMNLGQGIRKVRTLPKNDRRIMGYIY